MISHKNRVSMSVSGTPGTGTITLGSAVSAYQSFAAAHGANATVDVLITDGTAWEVARACTYTHSGTTLSRGTLEASSTGSAISLTSAAAVSQIATAQWGAYLESAMQAVTPGGRLTLTSGTPVTTSDVTAATTIYYTPYVHDTIPLWDGFRWVPITFAETSLALGTITNALPYDVFAYLSSGVLALELLAWTNGTTRATGVSIQDGRYCKTGDKTRLYLGTFRTTGTTTTEDSGGGASSVGGKRFLYNTYNRVLRRNIAIDTTNTWTYGSTTWRAANGVTSPANGVEFVIGLAETLVTAGLRMYVYASSAGLAGAGGIALDAVGVPDGVNSSFYNGVAGSPGIAGAVFGDYMGNPGVGYHYLQWVESAGTGTITFVGDNGSTELQSGMYTQIWN